MKKKEIVMVLGLGFFQEAGIKFLKDNNYYIIGVDENPNALCIPLCDEFIEEKLTNDAELIKRAFERSVNFAIAFECDPAVSSINSINEKLGLKSLSFKAREANLNKTLVREIQKKLGLRTPKYYNISSSHELIKTVKDSSISDWILKPNSSSGSRGVLLIDQFSDLTYSFEFSNKFNTSGEPLLLEEFISGREIAIDGFVINGKCHTYTISYKNRTPPPNLLDVSLYIVANNGQPEIVDSTKQLQAIFNELQQGMTSPYHAEFILGKDGVYLVEFSLRGAGFNVFSKLIPMVSGKNTLEDYIALTKGIYQISNLKSEVSKSIFIGFFEGKDGIVNKIDIDKKVIISPNILEFKIYIKPGERTKKLQSGADRIGHVIIESNDNNEEEFLRIFNNIKNSLKLHYET